MYLRPETILLYNCIFLALLYIFPYLSARRSHTASFCQTCVPGGHIPDGFWVVREGHPYRPHSLGDGSKCRRGKGLKTICLGPTRTSVAYYVWEDLFCPMMFMIRLWWVAWVKEAQTRVSGLLRMGVKRIWYLMLWLGFTLTIFSSCGFLRVPFISAYDPSRESMLPYASPSYKIAIMITSIVLDCLGTNNFLVIKSSLLKLT